eukprot:gene1258-1587_t
MSKVFKKHPGKQIQGPGMFSTLPLLGNLHLLGGQPHLGFHKLAQQYQHFFKFWMGDHYTVVVSDPKLLREIWVKNNDNFINRIRTPSFKIFSSNFRNLASGDKEYWLTNRAMVGQTFTKLKILKIANETIENETKLFIDTMEKLASSGQPVYPRKYFKKYSMNIILKYVFSESIPWEESVDAGRINRLLKPIEDLVGTPMDQIKTFIKEIHEDHLKNLDPENPRDLMDSFIIGCKESGLDPELPTIIGIDFLMAGTDTSSATVEWFALLMANYPHVQEKLYNELKSLSTKTSSSSKPFLSLKSKSEATYFNAVIKEVMRIHPIGPLGLPRVAHNDIFIDEYFIPKGTQMIQNQYTLSHSSDFWENPQDFIPERFLNDKHSDVFIPFSVGARNCIGQSLAQEEIYAICSNFILNFQVSPLDGVDQIEEDASIKLNEVKGPIAFPIIGNFNLLGKLPHRDLANLSKIYGKIYRLYLGDHYCLVVNDPHLIREIWVKNHLNFVNRQDTPTYKQNNGAFAHKSAQFEMNWKENRSIISSAFTKTKIKNLGTEIIETQSNKLLDVMRKYSLSGEPFYPRITLRKFSLNIIMNYVFSMEIPYEEGVFESRLYKPIEEIFKNYRSANPADFIDVIAPFTLFYRKYLHKDPVEDLYHYVKEIYDNHLKNLDKENPKDLMDNLIIEAMAKNWEPGIGIDFLLGGTDTSSSTMEWFLLNMCNHKEIQEKAYNELISQFGKGKFITMNDKQSTPYLNAIIRETLRMRPIAPLSLPRSAKEDIEISGYFIPKGTHMIQNLFAVLNSEDYWDRPLEFLPERFLLEQHNDNWIPFGVGPRNCVGQALAVEEVFVGIANILMNFEICSSSGNTNLG